MPASTSRSTRPSSSSSRSRCESSRSERPGTALPSSPKRIGRSVRAQTIAPVQRLPISSIAAWKCGQTAAGRAGWDLGRRRPVPRRPSLLNVSDGLSADSAQPVQGPVATEAEVWASASRTSSAGIAKPPGGPAVVAAKTIPTTSPAGVDQRPAGVAAADRAAQGDDRAVDRAVAVGVLADRVAGLAEPRRRDRVGAVLRIAEDGRVGARLALVGDRQGRQVGPDPQQRQVVLGARSRPGVASSSTPPWVVTVVSSAPAITWALVTIRPGCTAQPEPSTPSPQAVPSTRTTEPPASSTSGSVAIAGVGRRDRRRRPDHRGRRVDPVERVEDRARGRQHFVEAAQDHRVLDVGAQPRGRRARAARPRRRPRRGPSATEAIRAAPPAPSARCSDRPADHLRPQPQREALDRDRRQRPDQQRPQRRAERRVGGLGALGEHQRPEPAADEGTDARSRPGSARRRSAPAGSPTARGRW